MSQLSFKCQVPILIGASAFGYFFASKSHTYWCNACEEDKLIEKQKENSEKSECDNNTASDNKVCVDDSKIYYYMNKGIGCVGAAISTKIVYDTFLKKN